MTINRRMVTSALSIGAAGALLVGATIAFFTDTGTSSGNVFSTGTLDLQLGNGATGSATFLDSVTATFGDSNMAPGDCDEVGLLQLKNNGSVDADVKVTASNSNGALSPFLRVDVLTFDGSPVVIAESGGDGNAFVDLGDFAGASPVTLGSLSASEIKELTLQVCLDESAGNSEQNATNDLTLSFTLTSN